MQECVEWIDSKGVFAALVPQRNSTKNGCIVSLDVLTSVERGTQATQTNRNRIRLYIHILLFYLIWVPFSICSFFAFFEQSSYIICQPWTTIIALKMHVSLIHQLSVVIITYTEILGIAFEGIVQERLKLDKELQLCMFEMVSVL